MPPKTIARTPSTESLSGNRFQCREARLKPQYALLYPSLEPGAWESAVTLADRLLADRLLNGCATALRGRILLDAHFEFRGGSSRGGERIGMRAGGR